MKVDTLSITKIARLHRKASRFLRSYGNRRSACTSPKQRQRLIAEGQQFTRMLKVLDLELAHRNAVLGNKPRRLLKQFRVRVNGRRRPLAYTPMSFSHLEVPAQGGPSRQKQAGRGLLSRLWQKCKRTSKGRMAYDA